MICYEGQGFGENANNSYASSGLSGHTGQDWACGFGTPIKSPFNGFVYKVLTKENPSNDGSGFTGVFMIVDDGIECFEWLIGHCNPSVAEGQQVKAGDIIGTEANHGTVFTGNVQITLAMQAAGDERGSHRHEQKRPVQRLMQTRSGYVYLDRYSDNPAGSIYRDATGGYYEVFDYWNGFHGCVDPGKPVFTRDLFFGRSGYDVFVLQRFLAFHGYFKTDPTGFYGPITLAAVRAYQKDHGINPLLGYFGPKTRASIQLPSFNPTPLA